MRSPLTRPTPWLSLLLLLGSSCKSTPATVAPQAPLRAEITDEVTLSAQVIALDPARRALTVRREDGASIELLAAAQVRNYERIALGDTLRVRFQERLSAQRLPDGSGATPVEAALEVERAAAGEAPAAGVGLSVSLRVRIESIDEQRAIVVFSSAAGALIAHRLRTDEGRTFVAGLSVGDLVQLDYSERVALAIVKQ